MVLFDHWRERDLGLSLVTARPSARVYARAVREAYARGHMRRGRDRAMLFGPGVVFDDWPVSEIFDVQRAFSSSETLKGLHGTYTCVFVSTDPGLEPVIEAYRSFWKVQLQSLQAPTYLTAPDLETAGRMLGAPGLAQAFAPMLERALLRRTGDPLSEGP